MVTWSLDRRDRRRRTWRGLAAAVVSALLPGLGQLFARRWARAATLLTLTAVIGLIGWWYLPGPEGFLALVADRDARVRLHLGNAVVLLLRLGAAADAYLLVARPAASPALPRTATAILGTALGVGGVLAGTLLPHALLGYTAQRTGAVLEQVLVADGPATTAPIDPVVTPAPPSSATRERAPDPLPPELPPEPPPPPVNPWQDRERLTVAVLGSDAGPGRVGARLDAVLVASLDTRTGATALFSVDRYLADFPVPDHLEELYHQSCTEGEGWRYLNALYTCGVERIDTELAALYPEHTDPAAAAVADTLAELLQLDIDHHALVDMAGFVAVVDALGGVELTLETSLTVRMSPAAEGGSWRTFSLPEGRQVLDGEEALAYARVRGAGGDARRMQRQRCLVGGALASADLASLLRGFPAAAAALEEHLITDISTTQLPQLLRLLHELDLGPVVAEGLGPPTYRGADHRPDLGAMRDRVGELLTADVDGGDAEVVGADTACP